MLPIASARHSLKAQCWYSTISNLKIFTSDVYASCSSLELWYLANMRVKLTCCKETLGNLEALFFSWNVTYKANNVSCLHAAEQNEKSLMIQLLSLNEGLNVDPQNREVLTATCLLRSSSHFHIGNIYIYSIITTNKTAVWSTGIYNDITWEGFSSNIVP